jgi:CSLREA domain-containing protein
MRQAQGWTATAIVAGALAFATGAQAKTFEVTRASDPNPGNCMPRDCSLREAVQAANARAGADRVVLPRRDRAYKLTIPGDTSDDGRDGDLDVSNDSLAIVHPGKGRATIRGVDIDDRIFDVFAGAPLRLSRVKVTGGELLPANGTGGAIRATARVSIKKSVVAGNSTEELGGAIDTNFALTISDSLITRNRATGQGGALNTGEGALRITNSVLSRNDTGSTGGAIRSVDGSITIVRSRFIRNDAAGLGGAIRNAGTLGSVLIDRSAFSGNSSGAAGGALELNEGSVTIRASTINDNRAIEEGGGITAAATVLNVVNSTIAGNRTNALGGGIHAALTADVSLNGVTVVRNRAGADDPGPAPTTGGGIYQIDSLFEVRNSLIALNTIGEGGVQSNDCEGETYSSLGNNLLSTDVECDGFTATGDLVRANPKIGQLGRNGGPTATIELRRGSPAIGKAHRPSAPNRDQRGRRRDNQPDIGAFERGA